MPQKVILDVDTGGDDAVAILLAGHHSALQLVAVTVTHGNAPIKTTLQNTLRVIQVGKLEHVPVYAGAANPLVGPIAPTFPFQRALLPLPKTKLVPQQERAAEFLINYYLGPKGPDTIYMPLGPQTNLALALRLEPKIARRIPQIVTMGGAYIKGNITPSAEFNIYADPEAANIVFNSGIPITMVGLEVTAQALVAMSDLDAISNLGTPWATAAATIMRNEVSWFIEKLGWDGGEIFDALAVAVVINPLVVTTQPMEVNIELHGQFTRGRTVTDSNSFHKQHQNANVGIKADRGLFLEILKNGLQ